MAGIMNIKLRPVAANIAAGKFDRMSVCVLNGIAEFFTDYLLDLMICTCDVDHIEVRKEIDVLCLFYSAIPHIALQAAPQNSLPGRECQGPRSAGRVPQSERR